MNHHFFYDIFYDNTLDIVLHSPASNDMPNHDSVQSGFATNFGHSISGEGHRGVEGIIVVQTLKTFVTRLSTTLTDPTKSDNVVRYWILYLDKL